MKTEKQELYCHNCDGYVQFEIDVELNGNHVLNCPNCDHEHCRVVKDGKITEVRWDQRNGGNGYGGTIHHVSPTTTTWTTTSTWDTYSSSTGSTSGGIFLYGSWMNSNS